MVEKNTVSNEKKDSKHINLHSSFKCPENFKKCRFYNPNQPEESRCIKDSNIGYCVQEYFETYDQSEVINGLGDIRWYSGNF